MPVLLSPCQWPCFTLPAPSSSEDSISVGLPERIMLSLCNTNSFFMPGLSLAAMLRLAAALTFGMFIVGHHLGSAVNLHGTLQT